MQFLLDENLPRSAAHLLSQAGHDVVAVAGSPLSGLPDRAIIEICNQQDRILITLDQGVYHPPTQLKTGLVLIKVRSELVPTLLPALIGELVTVAHTSAVTGRVTVVSPGQVRSRPLE